MEKKIVDQFEVEELEKRFEMGWLRRKPKPFEYNQERGSTTVKY